MNRNTLKGLVYRDMHPDRQDRIFAIVWDASKFVQVYSTAGRVSRISKHRLNTRYKCVGARVNTNMDFKPLLFEVW